MKTPNKSLLDYAPLIILALALIVTCVGWGVRLPHTTLASSHSWFGYVPMSIQAPIALEYDAPARANP
jgi:hypothetical protein